MESNFMAENKGENPTVGGEVAKREEEVLDFWNTQNIFKKSEEKDAPKGDFVFYDGPPFATGLPHYGHILAGTIKDAIPRYRTMRGYRVRRRWGWDCHGLPLENEIEKELGLETKRDIEKLGVGKFNEAARAAVLRYADDWKRIVPRLGRWVDMDNDYRTMDASYTESVWWVFKQLYDKKLIYQGYKSMHLCPRCGTTLSNFEVQQGYKDITDFAVTVKLHLKPGQKYGPAYKTKDSAYLLVWTTTPWTLPGNMAAAVHQDAVYTAVRVDGIKELLILAKDAAERVLAGHEVEVVHNDVRGKDLVGLGYDPPFDYYKDADLKGKKNAWKIYHAPYVSMEEGTGAVHLAPAFGEEDMELAKQEGIPLVHHVTEDGVFAKEVKDFAGASVKPKDTKEEPEKHMSADIEIIKNLAHRGLLFKKEKITHSYPLCWRCDTPLLNYAASSWFVKATALRDKLVSENKKIKWVPREVGERRFGNWLENVRDWAISRSRYWGAPLPVWKNEKTGEHVVVGSIEELKKHVKRSGNRYFLMRHGESKKNINPRIVTDDPDAPYPLTERGKEEVRGAVDTILKSGIDLIFTSPVLRAKETAAEVADVLGLDASQIVKDDRICELGHGEWEGRPLEEYDRAFPMDLRMFDRGPNGGETWTQVRRRVGDFLYEIEHKHKNKQILIISHGDPLMLLEGVVHGLSKEQIIATGRGEGYPKKGEVRELEFVPLPHNSDYELDLHRPYIDDVELVDRNGNKLVRVPEVFDCWYESGSMPYGQYHYPFENTDVFDPKGGWFTKAKGYPADFIAEGMDQTRGWFYSLLVLGVALFGRSPYQNVIVNGTVLAEDGQKMSKRLKNYPDPMEVVHKHGADAIRYYLLSSGVVRGEDANFSEQGVAEVSRKIIMRLSNVLSFYELYAESDLQPTTYNLQPEYALDRWILARLSELVATSTEAMERYELDRATRPILDFIDDLSTWYLRRSRDRFKEEGDDKRAVLATTRTVLLELSKVMAPFTPFYAETLYQKVKGDSEKESVHLDDWPEKRTLSGDEKQLIADMKKVRSLASLALEERTRAKVKVRQPLRKIALKNDALRVSEDLLALLRDEVNVKEVTFDPIIEREVMLDTTLTPELLEEGAFRELVRSVQDLRKRTGLQPKDSATLVMMTTPEGKVFVEKHKEELRNIATLSGIEFADVAGEPLTIGEQTFTLSLRR